MKIVRNVYHKKLDDTIKVLYLTGDDLKELYTEPLKSMIEYNEKHSQTTVKVDKQVITVEGAEYNYPLTRNPSILFNLIKSLPQDLQDVMGSPYVQPANVRKKEKLSALLKEHYPITVVQVDEETSLDIRYPETEDSYVIMLIYKDTILGYTKGSKSKNGVYIEWVTTSPVYRGYGLCPFIIQQTLNMNGKNINYSLQNAGKVPSCYCYIKTFAKNGYIALIDGKKSSIKFCQQDNLDKIFNFINRDG